ncbi:MAG: FAD:protein FMN transferase [Polyangiales bacterium]
MDEAFRIQRAARRTRFARALWCWVGATAWMVFVVVLGCRNRTAEPEPIAHETESGKASASSPPVLPAPSVVTASYGAMGTAIAFKVWTDREPAARLAMDDAFQEIKRIEALMTTWSDSSEVSRINAAAGVASVEVSSDLLTVLRGAREMHEASHCVFDVSYYALKGLWHFDQDSNVQVPTDAEIRARLPLIDGRKIAVDEVARTVRLPRKGMAINLGGIAKGYAVDKAAAVLAEHGFTNAVVQAGGDLLVRGKKGNDPWRVGIRDPRGAIDDSFAIASIHDGAFSTAGDYERAFVKDGLRYHHIMDPRTGFPARACRSVTVLAPDALTADELDDAIFILGPEQGLALLEKYPGSGAVIIDKDNKVIVSERLKNVVEIIHAPTPGV